MLRRNARLRREYLYRKSLEGAELEEYERKRKIRQALEGEPGWGICMGNRAGFQSRWAPRHKLGVGLLLLPLLRSAAPGGRAGFFL